MNREDQLRKLFEYLNQAVEFSKDQAPQIAQEMLRFDNAMAVFGLLLGLVSLAVCAALWYKAWTYEDSMDAFPAGMIGSIFAAVGGIATIANTYTILHIAFAPKLYLLQRVAALLG